MPANPAENVVALGWHDSFVRSLVGSTQSVEFCCVWAVIGDRRHAGLASVVVLDAMTVGVVVVLIFKNTVHKDFVRWAGCCP